MNRIKVYLDDDRMAPKGWIRVNNVKAAIHLLDKGNVDIISLDHDLGTEETGYKVILWIENQVAMRGFVPPEIKIHSANAGAYDKMVAGKNSIERLHRRNVRISKIKLALPKKYSVGKVCPSCKGFNIYLGRCIVKECIYKPKRK